MPMILSGCGSDFFGACAYAIVHYPLVYPFGERRSLWGAHTIE